MTWQGTVHNDTTTPFNFRLSRDALHVLDATGQPPSNSQVQGNWPDGDIPPQSTSNRSKVSIPEVDQLLERGYQESNPERRRELYVRAQEILAQEAVGVPLVSMYRNIAVKKGVHGIAPDVRGTYRYYHEVWIEPGS